MAVDQVATSSQVDNARLHIGRVLILLAGVIGVIAVLLVIVASAA
ncbi:hypothetical protein nbrc107696_16600 [Gordonia spumicola]|uniref:Uncharacterized protein n=1 Tax=Gordonia spumicola TaxID=589161 RepID=A0A7I9V7K5_9ACTN|nr:hypothetical protein [Gordonia spumicola]GEE01214.1 hypothetical protein nbrc107696_16600 [Gordonia spumicola]